jgi:hypothetical protein
MRSIGIRICFGECDAHDNFSRSLRSASQHFPCGEDTFPLTRNLADLPGHAFCGASRRSHDHAIPSQKIGSLPKNGRPGLAAQRTFSGTLLHTILRQCRDPLPQRYSTLSYFRLGMTGMVRQAPKRAIGKSASLPLCDLCVIRPVGSDLYIRAVRGRARVLNLSSSLFHRNVWMPCHIALGHEG